MAAPGSAILDLGCNDGRIARHLLANGFAGRVLAVDREDLIPDKPSNLTFLQADVENIDLRTFQQVDVVLALNILHHLVPRSRELARETIQAARDISKSVVVDMGSFSERGPWKWRHAYEQFWSDDNEMFDYLFESAPRRSLLQYPAMSGGHRVLWHVEGRQRG